LFRASTPEDYPANFRQWIAMTLFTLGFAQLFLVFAPFDWSIRLSKRRWFAALFTILFGVFVLMVKTHSSRVPLDPSLFWLLVVVRTATSFLSVWLYSRYGFILVWWWGLLLQTRHLLDLAGAP
jgi:FtsH-binding integral membrane protein